MKKHGYSKHPLYAKLNQMKQRCYNKNHPLYHLYGAKGITVCQEWLESTAAFIEWSESHGYTSENCSINRINPKKGYSPDNCNYMTRAENSSYHPYLLCKEPITKHEGAFIRSMWFRNEEEIEIVKKFLSELRGKKTTTETPEQSEKPVVRISQHDEFPPLPTLLLDVMNGGTFPAPEDLTKAEQAILYNPAINELVNQYRKTKQIGLALMIRAKLDEMGVDF